VRAKKQRKRTSHEYSRYVPVGDTHFARLGGTQSHGRRGDDDDDDDDDDDEDEDDDDDGDDNCDDDGSAAAGGTADTDDAEGTAKCADADAMSARQKKSIIKTSVSESEICMN
jgi:hypothetical protein